MFRLISIMLGRLRMDVEQCIREFQNLSDLFDKDPVTTTPRSLLPYRRNRTWPSGKYEKAFHGLFQEHVATATSASLKKLQRDFNSDPGRCKTYVFQLFFMRLS